MCPLFLPPAKTGGDGKSGKNTDAPWRFFNAQRTLIPPCHIPAGEVWPHRGKIGAFRALRTIAILSLRSDRGTFGRGRRG